MPPLLKELGATEETLPTVYEALALKLRQDMGKLLDQAFVSAKVEVLVSLANSHSDLYATAGYPAITVPLGLDQDGMPKGVTLIGKPGRDAGLLAYAYAFEQATHFRVAPRAVDP
jgi:amidase